MKKIIILILLTSILFLFLACSTYHAGITIEQQSEKHIVGYTAGGEFDNSSSVIGDYSFVFLPNMYPSSSINAMGFGFDTMVYYPFRFLGNLISVYPLLGFDFRYIHFGYNADLDVSRADKWGIGIKAGAGLEVSITRYLYFRSNFFYQPKFSSFFNSNSGFHYYLTLGYRTSGSKVRNTYKSVKTIRIENIQKSAKESYDNKNYSDAINYYKQLIDKDAPLGSNGIPNLSAAYYERAKQNKDRGDYRQAVSDINSSTRHQYAMSMQKYADWKDIIKSYEEENQKTAPHDNCGKFIVTNTSNLYMTYSRESNNQNNRYETFGSGWASSLPAGTRVFTLTYDESRNNTGLLKTDNVAISFNIEEGRVYRALSDISGNRVTINIYDITESELGKGENINTRPVYTRTVTAREEKPRPQSVTITIVNNTGFTIKGAGMFPSDVENYRDSDLIIINLGGNLRSGSSRRVTLPALDLTRNYNIMLLDTDNDGYVKIDHTIFANMSLTFNFSDFIGNPDRW